MTIPIQSNGSASSRTAIHTLACTIIRIMIAHDLYHAGEINHIRALLRGTDRWPYD